MPITVPVIDSDQVNACTSPGGYQYVTRGLLLPLENEGELAAMLAHGIAHTALHSPTIQVMRQVLLQFAAIPGSNSGFTGFTCTSPLVGLPFGMRQANEFDADYFGVQYLYKAGYNPDCYGRFVQRIWPAPAGSGKVAVAFSRFPPTSERLKALRGEIAAVLPQRGEATVSTSAFEEFKEHLHALQTQHPEPKQPVLVRDNADE